MNNLNVPRYSNANYYNPPWINSNQGYQNSIHSVKKIKKEKSITNSFINTIKAFCKQTSVHGLKNVIDSFNEFKTAKSK